MMKMKPMTSAVPKACTVSANGQPQSSVRTAAENCELSSHASTLDPPSLAPPFPSRAGRKAGVGIRSDSKIGQQPAAHDHTGPCQQHRGGNPLGSPRGILSGLEV